MYSSVTKYIFGFFFLVLFLLPMGFSTLEAGRWHSSHRDWDNWGYYHRDYNYKYPHHFYDDWYYYGYPSGYYYNSFYYPEAYYYDYYYSPYNNYYYDRDGGFYFYLRS
jgi:hypothetical protein